MKKILLLIIFILSTLVIADSPKYDFVVTVIISDKTIKESAEILKDFEDFMKKYKGDVSISIKHEEPQENYWQPYIQLYNDGITIPD